ncbi:MAG: hypothetical protein HZC48_12170 [Nitrospirae bacterium]|nr:hypothetical protein [Nitrospirota bacterium]
MADNSRVIELEKLREGMPSVPPEYGACLAQAASVCLEDQGHSIGVEFNVSGDFDEKYTIHWKEPTEQIRRCWNDYEVTTEHGAYGLAFLLVKNLTQFTVIERSRKGTGFDYWLGTEEQLFKNKARLEVSGIRCGDERLIKARLKQKINQTKPSDGTLPAFIIVVEFSKPTSAMVKK